MIEQLWFRVIVIIFCLILSFLVGCSKKDIKVIEKGKDIIIELEKEEKDDDGCHGGVCPPPEEYKKERGNKNDKLS